MAALPLPKNPDAETFPPPSLMSAKTHPVIRVLLVDDHFLVRMGLANLFEATADICVVAETDNGSQAVALFRQHRPDVVLLDEGLPGWTGFETLVELRREFPESRVLMLFNRGAPAPDAATARRFFQAGAAGGLSKTAARAELLSAIRSVHVGKPLDSQYQAPPVAERLPVRLEGCANPEVSV